MVFGLIHLCLIYWLYRIRFLPKVLLEWGPPYSYNHLHAQRHVPEPLIEIMSGGQASLLALGLAVSRATLPAPRYLLPSPVASAGSVPLSGLTVIMQCLPGPLGPPAYKVPAHDRAPSISWNLHITNLTTFKGLAFTLRLCPSSLFGVIMSFLKKKQWLP